MQELGKTIAEGQVVIHVIRHSDAQSVRGTLVTPNGGTKGDGIYAHHPPLAVWVMSLPVALGGWEGFSRLIALACAGATLFLLHRLLRRSFDPGVALAALASAALSTYLLRYGRLLTTLTLAAPLFVALLDLTLRRERTRWWGRSSARA